MAEKLDDTILNMVKNLKPSLERSRNYDYSPFKRSLSSSNSNESSYDDPTPAKRPKQENRLDLSYIGSPRELRRMRADLVESRNNNKALESRINQLQLIRKQEQMVFDEENKTLRRQSEYDRKSKEELEIQLQSIRKREIELKHKLSEVNHKYESLKINTCEEVEKLEESIRDLKDENREMESEENRVIPTLERRISELENMLEAAEQDAEAHKKLAEELEKRIKEDISEKINFELKELELRKAKLSLKEMEYTIKSFGEYQEQAKNQADKLAKYIELEKENKQLTEENVRLKEQVRNKLILEEEVHDLKTRLVKFKDYEKKISELQTQETQNAMYLNEWRAVARGICESMESDFGLPQQLRSVVERLQQQELSLTAQKVELESQLKSITHEAKLAKSEAEKCHTLLNELKQTGEQKQKLIHKMDKRLTLVSRERDSYRLQLDSYEKDLTMYANTTNFLGSASSLVQSQKDRIDNLEKIVADYRDMVSKLDTELQNVQPHLYSDAVPLRVEQNLRLKEEVQQLRLENENLHERRNELEARLEAYLEGEDSIQGGKIFHIADNPLSECLAQREKHVEKLEQEVDRLKRKIKNLEEGIENSKLGDITINSKELNSLKEQLKSQESQTQLVKEYFKSQMQEFRNVIYMLLGYKIDRTQNSLYKLTSMYADRPSDLLCFQYNKEGDLDLLENEFSATLESMINLHLMHQKSIPVFLSALTMDLFNNKTMTKAYE